MIPSRRHRRHAAWALWPWLCLPASLTAALRRAYGAADWPRARVLECGRARPHPEERRALGLNRTAWVYWREVELHGPDPQKPAIWARSSFPLRAISQGLQPLTRHGSRPIGNTLFRHRRLRRSPIQIDAYPVYGPRRRWRRSSILQRGARRVWVEEHLLPDLPRWRGRGR
ncbi:chorismate lyase [Acidithiobacillus sp. CV18-2]|uniref:Chorismate lyase n=1 Tax=Igneacidithiobacillus copahuensis TaxID=2724909 RepID=A0AAE3CJJ7_9PROT|nr:chorismate lyase [Igneacidithiobacillus copahuensis]MBU2753618.1 chorismate lyase [Acidithiobacillus sp. CV18-3]MBU2758530.1 chorismate lyase [Acidithiobacillus sp. BN09-2]MBU2776336.1 chorismate lyase [Acidithiobacillus sp. CV18-2]MBU2795252.1 chorismate lyase [Acidithiobacillus sp. VAN18-2]MBU2799522.1 chorismate lyase [Acidithiobacillus sp. VAN18-4]UTV81321.1 chorismate lyase [Acidithiobacillus sp. YTS05]